jgi:hypothetical protein
VAVAGLENGGLGAVGQRVGLWAVGAARAAGGRGIGCGIGAGFGIALSDVGGGRRDAVVDVLISR